MKKILLKILTIASLFCIITGSLSAQATIKGVVRVGNSTSTPTGITINIQGTSTFVSPDIYGRYTLTAEPGIPVTLVASLIGYDNLIKTITPVLTWIPGLSNYVDFWFEPPPETISDFDGNIYKTVTIGPQRWMAENLRATHFQDGAGIQYVANEVWTSEWTNPRTKYCYYNNNGDSYRFEYGALYNYYAVTDGNLCPTGWHVSTNTDWTTLASLLGGEGIAGAKLKEIGTSHWAPQNADATNETGFTALPGGSRDPFDAGFEGLGSIGFWWSNDLLIPYFRVIQYNSPELVGNNTTRTHGLSARCVKNMLSSLSTTPVSLVTTSSAQSGGNITYDGGAAITRRGLCWSTSPGPNITNDTTWDRGSSSTFTNIMRYLVPNTTYHVRAYATNSEGTAYGNTISFTTSPYPPLATSRVATAVASVTATLNGTVTANDANTTVTFEYGNDINYGASINATPNIVTGITNTAVCAVITGLTANTAYHFRIKAENSGGIAYGEDLTFTTPSRVSDYDGNNYNIVKIGDQLWFQENLKVTKYRNGDLIIYTDNWAVLGNSTDGAYCNYDNSSANGDMYGRLYNYYATVDNRNLCPTGWHVPTDNDWVVLENYLIANSYNYDGTTTENKIAKALAAASGWETSTVEGAVGNTDYPAYRNKSGFTGLPGGHIYADGIFRAFGTGAVWWSSTETDATHAIASSIWKDYAYELRSDEGNDFKSGGFSVRCLQGEGIVLPRVSTVVLSEIATTTVTSGGNITSDGGSPVTARGICWSTSQNPTVENNYMPEEAAGIGTYTSYINDLVPGTTYYVRGYATNSIGTAYGNELVFTTLLLPPVATSNEATGVSTAGAVLNGIVNANGLDTDVTFEYGLTTTYGSTIPATSVPVTGIITAPVIAYVTGLSENTTYHFRVIAENTVGRVVGRDLTFTTSFKVTDFDGNEYNTLKIGDRLWFQENLKVLHYSNGDAIPNVTDDTWKSTLSGAYRNYGDDESNALIYGRLYNYYTTIDSRSLCPTGWHVPTQGEWVNLENYLISNGYNFDGTSSGNKIAKALASTNIWESSTVEGAVGNFDYPAFRNKSGFSGLPAGLIYPVGPFQAFGSGSVWWSSTEKDATFSIAASIWKDYIDMFRSAGEFDYKNAGFSVRCIQNSSNQTIVLNTNDNGEGSLRNAIEYANATVGVKETITFNIPAVPYIIQPTTQLPAITDPVIIDGYTQPGAKPATESGPATILVEIVGNASDNTAGLILNAGNSTISGLSIKYFRVNMTIGGTGNNIVKGNYFTGMNGTRNNIYINSSDNEIGGRSPAARNVITVAEAGHGIEINNTNSHFVGRNRIVGNYIGIDPTGEQKRGNDFAGVSIVESPDNIIGGPSEGERNVISGNITGISISGVEATGNRIEGNYIGTNAGGTKGIGNDTGIYINAPGNFVGGSAPGAGNLISGNGGPGGGYTIRLNEKADGNVIQGNLIGTDRTGFNAIPNQLGDVIKITGGNNNQIGGLVQGARNIIAGNWENAIQIDGTATSAAEGNKIQGNYIGTDISGKTALGNSMNGIVFGNYANNNLVGGNEPGAGNIIAFNKSAGVAVGGTGNPGKGNAILTNSIHSNGGLGIDLGTTGITSNDSTAVLNENTGKYDIYFDWDDGPNNLQNFPVIASITYSRSEVEITGTLRSAPNTEYNLQFYANKLSDESGYGEGQVYLGSASVTTSSLGVTPFSETFTRSTSGEVFTATATDPSGNTSEFSKAIGGLESQILAENRFSFRVNELGVPNVLDDSDIDAVVESFAAWSDIETADIEFTDGGTTEEKYAGYDDMNLVTFVDDKYDIPWMVLAMAAKTWHVDESSNTTQIVDVDIIFNPYFVNHHTYNLGVEGGTYDGYFDIQSVTTHEIGHVLGLLHSGVFNSTMWFQIGEGTTVRELIQDDKSWASYRYPSTYYNTTFGSISGRITYGYDQQQPVAGALVLAINTATDDTIHAYSDAKGDYLVPGLFPGDYYIFIEPLDGDVRGRELWPGNISYYIGNNTIYLDYPGEFYNESDNALDSDDAVTSVSVTVGSITSGKDIITNQDKTPPTVELVKPTLASGALVNILSNFNIRFSELVDMETLNDGTCYLSTALNGTTEKVTGSFTRYQDYPTTILFDPNVDLKHNRLYTLHLTTGVKDLRGNGLENEYLLDFTTIPKDEIAPEINEVIPAANSTSVYISSTVKLIFSEPMKMSSVQEGFSLTWTEESTLKTVGGSFSWKDYNKMVTFTPSGYLLEGTVYTISVSGDVEDLSGNTMGIDKTFTFTTVNEAAPIILYVGPGNEDTDVTITTPVVVDFSEPINTSSVNASTFKLIPGINPEPDPNAVSITGTYEFFNENSTVVFRPLSDLTINQGYTIVLTKGIKDVSIPSSALEMDNVTTFTTAGIVSEPKIIYLEAANGVTGNIVTISGSGFEPDPVKNTVKFCGINAVVNKANLTSLEVQVPADVKSGSVYVVVNGKTSNSKHFDVLTELLDPSGNVIVNAPIGTKSTHGTAATPEGAYVYVTNPEEGTVSVVDMITLDVETIMIGEGRYPLRIDINPEGTKAYVTNYYSSDVSVIDLIPGADYNTVIKNISVGIGPFGITVTPDGKRVYVANYGSGNLSMIDTDPTSGGFDHAVANVSTGSNSRSVAVSPDAGLVVVTGDFGLIIINSDPDDKDKYNTAIANVSAGTKTREVAITPDAAFAIVSTDDGYLLLVALYPENGDYKDAVVANVSTGSNVSDIKVRGDCGYVYLTDTEGDQILVYKIAAGGTGNTNSSIPAGIGMTLIYVTAIPVGDTPEGLALEADRLYVIDGTLTKSGERRVTVIQLGLLSVSDGFSRVIEVIQGMINAGEIKSAIGNDLISKLKTAQKYLEAGKTKSALNSINMVVVKIKDLIKSRQIDEIKGNYILNMLYVIIADINDGTKSGEIDNYYFDPQKEDLELIPETKIGNIFPNPSKDAITIDYEIAENELNAGKTSINVYDLSGRLVRILVNSTLGPGRYSVSWDGNSENGTPAPRGIYFIRLESGNTEQVKQILLVR